MNKEKIEQIKQIVKTTSQKKEELEESAKMILDQCWVILDQDGVSERICVGDELLIVTLEESFDENGSYKGPVVVTITDDSDLTMVRVKLPSGKHHVLGKGDKILHWFPKT